jgi:hypothetical protein
MQSSTGPLATLDFDGLRPPAPFMSDAHHAWRAQLRDFVAREALPQLADW